VRGRASVEIAKRELGFYAEVVPHDALGPEDVSSAGALVLSGGPSSVLEEGAPRLDRSLLELALKEGKPVLGICYGHQLLALTLGGAVERGERGEYGSAILEVLVDDPLFSGTLKVQRVWMSHRDRVASPPPGSVVLARTETCEVAAFKLAGFNVYGVQFHPEVKHTEHGARMLENFLRGVAGLEPRWRPEDAVESVVERVRAAYKGGNVLVAASGGVDSTTAAYIVKLAVGPDPIHLVVIDTGLLREGEAERAVSTLKSLGFKHVHPVDASRKFLNALKGVVDPEEKRRVIARVYFDVLERKARELSAVYGEFRYLVQGTIYPDRIESGRAGRGSDRIKSHHNVALPERLGLELIEPLADFYKDEVRRIALSLGLPEELVYQHPFPGPGLAVRVIGEVTEEKLRIVRKATRIVEEELRAALHAGVHASSPAECGEGSKKSYALRVTRRIEPQTRTYPSPLGWRCNSPRQRASRCVRGSVLSRSAPRLIEEPLTFTLARAPRRPPSRSGTLRCSSSPPRCLSARSGSLSEWSLSKIVCG